MKLTPVLPTGDDVFTKENRAGAKLKEQKTCVGSKNSAQIQNRSK